jgi:AraC-like DNA-binding protein
MVAAAHHISTRCLQKLFAAAGITVAGCIKERRLERCRHDLEDPSLLRDSIGTICARHGYIDSAHFSRLFKQRYGLSPRAFRDQMMRGGTPRLALDLSTGSKPPPDAP